MKFFLSFLIPILFVATTSLAGSPTEPKLTGRWRVNFSLVETKNKNLIFEVKPKGSGLVLLLDTGPDDKPVPDPQPAVWSQIDNGRVSFAANVELSLGTCCREVGTLIFKGTYASDNSIKGRAIFIASTTDEENFIGYRSSVGSFTATREH
jgi:hypothetical protein